MIKHYAIHKRDGGEYELIEWYFDGHDFKEDRDKPLATDKKIERLRMLIPSGFLRFNITFDDYESLVEIWSGVA